MTILERPDDFETRRKHLQDLSDKDLHARFWSLVDKIVEPLLEEARTHTSPSIERSVLMRMGFSSLEAKSLVTKMQEKQLLAYGAGRLVLELSKKHKVSVRQAGEALLQDKHWKELPI